MKQSIWFGVALAMALVTGVATKSPAQNEAIQVTDASGAVVLKLTPIEKGYAVTGKGGVALGKVKMEPDRAKVSDASGKPAFKVKDKNANEGFKLYKEPSTPGAADIEQLGFWWEDRGFQVKDANDREIMRGKGLGVEMKVRHADGRTFTYKGTKEGIHVYDAAKKQLAVVNTHSPAAALFCALKEYEPLQKAAVLAHLSRPL